LAQIHDSLTKEVASGFDTDWVNLEIAYMFLGMLTLMEPERHHGSMRESPRFQAFERLQEDFSKDAKCAELVSSPAFACELSILPSLEL
jgi:hypothetical protein